MRLGHPSEVWQTSWLHLLLGQGAYQLHHYQAEDDPVQPVHTSAHITMKAKKAISWEKLSEGTLTASEITCLTKFRQPITMTLSDLTGTKTATVQIVVARGPVYNVLSQTARINPKPYKYLSCAVRRAVKAYKTLLQTRQWKCLTKV